MRLRRALSILKEVRVQQLSAGGKEFTTVNQRDATQAKAAKGVLEVTPRPGSQPQSHEEGLHLTRSEDT